MWTLEEGKITLFVIWLLVYIRLGGEWWNHPDQQVFISLLRKGLAPLIGVNFFPCEKRDQAHGNIVCYKNSLDRNPATKCYSE